MMTKVKKYFTIGIDDGFYFQRASTICNPIIPYLEIIIAFYLGISFDCIFAIMSNEHSDISILKTAQSTIEIEIAALQQLKSKLGESFSSAVQLIHGIKGRVVITGIGKSAIIGQKIVATLNSTGTASLFMHAADAIHGDLGMIQPEDVVIVISKSGESAEIKALIPLIKNFGNKIIAICGNENAYLAQHADYFIDTTVDAEACPNNLAPTTSTTAQLVMGDAIAVCLLNLKGFTSKDFAKFHPGGALGKRLYLTVEELSRRNEKPQVNWNDSLREVIIEISSKRLGATAVLKEGMLAGIITDGDLRRMLLQSESTADYLAKDICTANPKTIEISALAVVALEMMRENNITQLIVEDKGRYAGMVHLHDLIREGII